MRILYVIGSLGMGGAERHLVNVASRLTERGYEVSIFCLLELGPLEKIAKEAGVEVISPSILWQPTFFRKFLRAVFIGLSLIKLFGIFLWRRPPIVHFFLPLTYILGAILGKVALLPRMLMSRRSMNLYQLKHKYLSYLEGKLHKSMLAALGNSQRVLSDLRKEGVPEEDLGLIYNGIDIAPYDILNEEDRKKTRQALGLDSDVLILVIVANLIPYKGHLDLLKGLSAVKNNISPKWKLLIVGRDDGIGNHLAEHAAQLGLSEYLLFLGLRKDIPKLLNSADLGILCSHEEGFSNALLEYMAAGLPVVATDAGGNKEAVVDGVTGLIVEKQNPEQLGQAILTVISDKDLATQMGTAGRRRVQECFSLEGCVNRYDELYQSLMEGKKVSEMVGLSGDLCRRGKKH